jgi:UDP-4-amino-4,6-dideoxy-N-acetyl-beta-L-altrosamine transaminase
VNRRATARRPNRPAAIPGISPAPLPYGNHLIEDDDVAAVVAAMRSELLAQGPRVAAFEAAFAERVGAPAAVACSSGTAALHLALALHDVGPGDVCIVPAITFLATATAARFLGAEVVFCDVDPETGLMTEEHLTQAMRQGAGAKAVLPVHLGGRVCDMPAISRVASLAGSVVIEDACHALGSIDANGAEVGACSRAAAATFSFHPVKTIAAGEGGMIALADAGRAERLKRLRNHGVTRDPEMMSEDDSFTSPGIANPWIYEQIELGFNYRMNEMEAALGLSQLGKLSRFVDRRRRLATRYDELLAPLAPLVRPTPTPAGQRPSPHLYTVLVDFETAGLTRAHLMLSLQKLGVGVQVHYIPLYRQPYFLKRYGYMRLPGAEAYYRQVLALPLFPAMSEADVERVVRALAEVMLRR